MSEEMFIDLISNYPLIYLCSDKNYHNLQMKENAWEEISTEMSLPIEECKKKWRKLKDCYRKALSKKRTRNADSTDSIPKKWKFEDEMSFLLPNFKSSNLVTTVTESGTNEYNEDTAEVLFDDTSFSSEVCDDTPAPSTSTYNNSPFSKVSCFQKTELKTAEVLQKYLENRDKRRKSDHLTKFFEFAEETTRTFPHELQVEVKQKISMLLYEYEMKTIKKISTSVTKTENTQPDSDDYFHE